MLLKGKKFIAPFTGALVISMTAHGLETIDKYDWIVPPSNEHTHQEPYEPPIQKTIANFSVTSAPASLDIDFRSLGPNID